MKDMLSMIAEFFFDVFGIFVPGLALLAAIYWMGFVPIIKMPTNGYEAVLFILACYLLGHALFALSQVIVPWLADRTIKDPKKTWLDDKSPMGPQLRDHLRAQVISKWCLAPDCLPDHVAYELCRNYIHIQHSERASFLRKEQTYGELSRSMVVVSTICLVAVGFAPTATGTRMSVAALLITNLVLFYLRYLKARQIDACFVYTNFIVLLEEEGKQKEQEKGIEAKAA